MAYSRQSFVRPIPYFPSLSEDRGSTSVDPSLGGSQGSKPRGRFSLKLSSRFSSNAWAPKLWAASVFCATLVGIAALRAAPLPPDTCSNLKARPLAAAHNDQLRANSGGRDVQPCQSGRRQRQAGYRPAHFLSRDGHAGSDERFADRSRGMDAGCGVEWQTASDR